ncbi:MAG: ATP-binding protein [Bacteroidota bacterium]
MAYIHRAAEDHITRLLKLFPVVGLTGPRQSGKSTMVRAITGNGFRYVSFDDPAMVDLFYSDPVRFIESYDQQVIFDEAQKVPEIFNYIKLIVDRSRTSYGRFIVTGSSQFGFLKHISESLAGRIGLLTLLPFQYSEVPSAWREESIYRGAYPELVLRKYEGSFDWYSSYFDTYLTRDVRDLREIGDIRDFKRFIRLLAARASQLLNMSDVARDIGISVPTVKKWISVLEASYIIFLLPPFYNNFGKRIVKSPKLYFYDTGFVSFLTGIRNQELYENGPMSGAIFENYIVSEIMKKVVHTRSDADLYYYRTSNGAEVDLIIDNKSERHWIEIKSSHTFRPEMILPLTAIKKKKDKGFVLYQGKAIDYTPDISIMNYKNYLID